MSLPIHLILDELDWDPRKALPVALDLGLRTFGLRMFNDHRFPRVPEDDHRWLEDLHDRDVCRFDVITPGINKGPFEPDECARMLDVDLRLCLDRARRLDVPEISLFSWAKTADAELPPAPGELSPSAPFDAMVDALRQAADRAAAVDRRISVEVGYQCWGDTGLGVDRMLRAADRPNLGLLWDPVNSLSGRIWWGRVDPAAPPLGDPLRVLLEELEAVAPRIVGVHVRDVVFEPPDWRYVLLGEGALDWPILLRALWDHGYRGSLTIEHHIQPPDKECATRHTLAALKPMLPSGAPAG